MSATASTAVPILEMFDVTLAATRVEADSVTGIEWCVQPGEFWVVGGGQWGGKSDLLATAAGLQRPASGSHWLFGQNTAEMEPEPFALARRRVGLVFENGGRLFNHLTVADNVSLALRYHEDCETVDVQERVKAVLELTGLVAMADHLAGNINRSWRQRVALARALALQPELLLLDNPVVGLDLRQTRWWMDFLGALNAGHAFFGGRPLTLVVAAADFRPWAAQARQFALLKSNGWLIVGGRAELAACSEPQLREMLAEEQHVKSES